MNDDEMIVILIGNLDAILFWGRNRCAEREVILADFSAGRGEREWERDGLLRERMERWQPLSTHYNGPFCKKSQLFLAEKTVQTLFVTLSKKNLPAFRKQRCP